MKGGRKPAAHPPLPHRSPPSFAFSPGHRGSTVAPLRCAQGWTFGSDVNIILRTLHYVTFIYIQYQSIAQNRMKGGRESAAPRPPLPLPHRSQPSFAFSPGHRGSTVAPFCCAQGWTFGSDVNIILRMLHSVTFIYISVNRSTIA